MNGEVECIQYIQVYMYMCIGMVDVHVHVLSVGIQCYISIRIG